MYLGFAESDLSGISGLSISLVRVYNNSIIYDTDHPLVTRWNIDR